MSSGWLFAVGAVVTVLVAIGVALPIYGAILDGRFQEEHDADRVHDLSARRSGHRPAA